MNRSPAPTHSQSGMMLLEGLLAILIFSFGILAIVGMQANAMQDMGQAKYRSDASFLANQLISDIWTNAKNVDKYEWAGSGAPPALISNWVDQAKATLPGATDYPPLVEYTAANKEVTVTVRWLTPAEHAAHPTSPPHAYKAVTYINVNS